MLDAGPYAGFRRIGPAGFLAMDLADAPVSFEPCLVGLAAIGRNLLRGPLSPKAPLNRRIQTIIKKLNHDKANQFLNHLVQAAFAT
jgi:hypothetical protein